ncbi:MAG: hypothetical protein RLY97_1037 [Pseudomonadota bacterium]
MRGSRGGGCVGFDIAAFPAFGVKPHPHPLAAFIIVEDFIGFLPIGVLGDEAIGKPMIAAFEKCGEQEKGTQDYESEARTIVEGYPSTQ